MNIWIVQLLLIVLVHLHVDIVHSEENCYRGELYDYDNPCYGQPGQPEKLDYCPAGTKLVERCTERCEFCDPGTFSDSFNDCESCKPCLTECPKGQVITRECTSERDAECGCPPQPCPTSPPVTCEPCPVITQCPTVPKQPDVPVTTSEPGVPLMFTRNCPPDIEIWTDDKKANKSITWDEPEATPGSKIVHQSYKPGHYFPIGHFKAAYVFANNLGAVIACSFSIVVRAPVSTTGQPRSDPPEYNLISYVIGFIVGVVLTVVILLLLWFCCYRKKFLFLKRMCPHHEEEANKEDGKEEHQILLPPDPNAHGDGVNRNECNHRPIPQAQGYQDNHQRAAGGLAQAGKHCSDNKDEDNEMKPLNEEDKETGPEHNHQNGPSGPGDVGQTNGGQRDSITTQETELENNRQSGPSGVGQSNGLQEDHKTTQDGTQKSPSTSYSSGQFVALPPEESSSIPPDTQSHSELSSNQVDEQPDGSLTNTSPQSITAAGRTSLPQYENVAISFNKDVDVSEVDIEELAAIVADNDYYYDRRKTFLRWIMGYKLHKRTEETVDKNTDRNTRLVQFLHRGWLEVAPSRKRSDLAAKIRNFDKSLEQEFIRRINELDES